MKDLGPETAHAADVAPKKRGSGGGVQPGAGRPPVRRLLSTFRELAQKHGTEALQIVLDIARSGEPDLVRFAAAKGLIERGYGENPDAASG